jgi:hypothetical protein
MIHVRPALRSLLLLALFALAPTLAYEGVQKSNEVLLRMRHPHSILLRLGQRAEDETHWRAPTGLVLVDRALHEWAETRRFYTLARRRLAEPSHRLHAG